MDRLIQQNSTNFSTELFVHRNFWNEPTTASILTFIDLLTMIHWYLAIIGSTLLMQNFTDAIVRKDLFCLEKQTLR